MWAKEAEVCPHVRLNAGPKCLRTKKATQTYSKAINPYAILSIQSHPQPDRVSLAFTPAYSYSQRLPPASSHPNPRNSPALTATAPPRQDRRCTSSAHPAAAGAAQLARPPRRTAHHLADRASPTYRSAGRPVGDRRREGLDLQGVRCRSAEQAGSMPRDIAGRPGLAVAGARKSNHQVWCGVLKLGVSGCGEKGA